MAASTLAAGVAVVGGWSAQEYSRRRSQLYEVETNILGRRLFATPEHLSRVLYFPRHGHDDNDTYHLPVYDISRGYKESVADTLVGSSLYIVKLGTMDTPRGDGTDDVDVAYLVDFERRNRYGEDEPRSGEWEGEIAKVQRAGPLRGEDDDEVELKISASPKEAGLLTFKEPFGTGDKAIVPLDVSYQIAASKTKLGDIPHPYFTFSVPGIFGPTVFQWQVHPVQDGPLRYSLVVLPSSSSTTEGNEPSKPPKPPSGSDIRAIYHHIGLGVSLSLPYSEGILLLPERESTDSEWEGVVVASLLGMLWRLREIGLKRKNRKRASIVSTTNTMTNSSSATGGPEPGPGPVKKGNLLSKLKVKVRRYST